MREGRELIIISAMWCPSCLILNKIKKKIIEDFKDLTIKVFDYDIDEEIVNTYSPGDILPVMILKNHNETKRLIGEHSYKEIKEFLKEDGENLE